MFTSPNGTVYVAFQNFNNAVDAGGDNHNQVLIVKSTDGGTTWSAPVKVADFYDLPDCFAFTGFDQFRSCVPTAPLSGTSIFRATNYPSGAATDDDTVVIDFGSYINPHSNPTLGNCTPDGFSATTGLNLYVGVGEVGGCNNDILRSVSTDGGSSFTGTTTAARRARGGEQRRSRSNRPVVAVVGTEPADGRSCPPSTTAVRGLSGDGMHGHHPAPLERHLRASDERQYAALE